MKYQLGRLPPIPDKRRLLIAAPTWAVPAPPPVVDHLSNVPLEMDGNDSYGDCVTVAIRNHFYATWLALCPGEPVPPITRQDCLDMYWALCGTTTPPGPGLVTEKALDYLLTVGIGGQKALAWAAVSPDWTSIEQVNAEFVAGIYGVGLVSSQVNKTIWDDAGGQLGHEVGGGKHDPTGIYAATWGYIVRMTSAFVGNDLGEHHVIIWPRVWDALSPQRQSALAADYQALTGRPFPVPAPAPIGATMYVGIDPVRFVDSRTSEPALSHPGPLQPGLNIIDIAGLGGGIPATATDVACKIEVIGPTAFGWVEVGPGSVKPGTSVLEWEDYETHGMNCIAKLTADRKLHVWLACKVAVEWDFDVRGYMAP